jgi:acylpyruvate hydrolase
MKIICIGRNYSEHAKEMKAEVPTEPVFFMKPDTSILKDGNDFYFPDFTKDLHFECELVVKIDKNGKNISEIFSHKYYSKFSLGIDFTARDLQAECKAKGLPWEKAKAFEHSAPISNVWIDKSEFQDQIDFDFFQNGQLKQKGNSKDMLFSIDQIISYVSKYMTLKTGDLIYTGTPAGVGPVRIGDTLKGVLNGREMFTFKIK